MIETLKELIENSKKYKINFVLSSGKEYLFEYFGKYDIDLSNPDMVIFDDECGKKLIKTRDISSIEFIRLY